MGENVTACADCSHFDRHGTDGVCRRYAPQPCGEPFEVTRWPETRAVDGCGDGAPRSASDVRASCGTCRFWLRPGIGIDPSQRGDHLRAWWQEAGYCRRHAPNPGVQIGHRAFWRVVHARESCAEGRPVATG